MTRFLLVTAATVLLPLAVCAGEPAVRLQLRPMAAPVPAFKHQLLPELGEMNPGNPAQSYSKCFMEERNFFFHKDSVADRARYQKMPLAELPVDKLRDYGGVALRQADWSARLDGLDWQALQRVQAGGIEGVPAEVGLLELLGGALQVRFRAEIAGKRYDDALRTAKTMFALARHLGEYPSGVGSLVGLWVAGLGLGCLEEMVQQPGCPNLYWALTDLPSPLVELRKGVQGDRTMMAAELRSIRADAPVPDADLEQYVSRLAGVTSFAREQAGHPPRSLRTGLRARVGDAERVRAARRRLVEAGCAKGLAEQFSPVQVILLDEKRAFELHRDERLKLLAVPVWKFAAAAREPGGDTLFADLLPQVVTLRRSQARLERQVALLRHVEALRLYAAAHGGKLPAKLSELAVPLPSDPLTGQPFEYALQGATAHLRAANKGSGEKIQYEVTVQTKP